MLRPEAFALAMIDPTVFLTSSYQASVPAQSTSCFTCTGRVKMLRARGG